VYSLFAAYLGKRKFKMLKESENNGNEGSCGENDYEGIHKNNNNLEELKEIVQVAKKEKEHY